jgi:tetratricopeptide (TPR) repeat protein
MTRTATHSHGQPSLEDLTVRFLATRSDAAATAVEPGEGEVEPHEVATGFRVDPSAAWNDATCQISAAAGPLPLPPDWGTLVNQPAPTFAVPMALGSFPQRVRDLQPLLTKFDAAELRPSGSQTPVPGLVGLRGWIAKNAARQPLLAAGVARTIGDFPTAERLLTGADADSRNERAALLWQRGDCETALTAWESEPESPAVLFNRGMAQLFLGKLEHARTTLTQAIAALPEASGWNALARLYLAVAQEG